MWFNFPHIDLAEYDIVTSDKTEEVFKNKKDNEVLFEQDRTMSYYQNGKFNEDGYYNSTHRYQEYREGNKIYIRDKYSGKILDGYTGKPVQKKEIPKEEQNIEKPKEKAKEKTKMIEKIKKSYDKHEDILFPLLIAVVADYFFNDGRFRKKITDVMNSLLDSVTDKFAKKEEKDGE